MRQMERQVARWAVISLVAAAEALAQELQQTSRRILVSSLARKLALIENDHVVKTYPVAVGAASTPSPTGIFAVVNRIPHPTWYQPGKVVPPGKNNPLGTRWMGLSLKGFGIHGTNSPRSIGRAASHGCIRMRNRDVEELFEFIREGDVVELDGGQTPEVAQIFAPAEERSGRAASLAAPASGE